ncbi:hypothetical protein A4D02_18200 [Niastella koreensis]|uniref:RHS repeat-associated core domain protein n=2 Tax=Niastella koreensis TaxID=354356 RepID=G8TAA8_NIAKG|nr:RHS repeat-associated core domain-containing protein [Niastella koreensis]AEV97055.1 RHS repeat-associated core domain protein [Niastella koreensis GR20-10]OQP39255.1 hypothetical protein A4D02_18200 [Niastella koreensis]
MRKLLLLVPFLLLCLYSFAQTNIRQDNRVSPVLKRAVSPQSGYNTYGRTGRFINMAVLNTSSHTISWFTCYGRLFDSTRLDDQEFKEVTAKQIDPFTLYQNICDKYLADIAAAKDIYRVYGGNQLLVKLPGNYQALFAMESVQAAKTPLQKLMAIENVRKKILMQLAWLNCANPASLHDDPLYRANKEQAGSMVQTKDSTVYYNIDPTSAVAKISLYITSPEKLYVQNRLGEVIDSVALLPAKSALLQKEKTDVFLLYRGWLEMQWQEAMYAIKINNGEYRQVNGKEEGYRLLNAIRAKINLLISPEAKCIEQAVYEAYRSEASEIYYIPLLGISYNLVQTRGLKEYELSNHLGNVLVTVNDKKIGVPATTNSSLIDHYEPDIVSAQDYYPFGMLQPGRSLASSGDKYRYGFNGKENDNEVKGEGNQQDYGMRVYDPRLGKFLSVDPLTNSYPFYTPYQFSGNMPITAVDLDGSEAKVTFNLGTIGKDRTWMNLSTSVNIKIQIINLSATSDDNLSMETIRQNLSADLSDKLGGPATVNGINIPFVFKATDNKITSVTLAKKGEMRSYNITYNTTVTADVSIVHDISQIARDGFVFAIVDDIKDEPGMDTRGLADQKGGKVAMGEASEYDVSKVGKEGRQLTYHEVLHLLGAVDTYKKDVPHFEGTDNNNNVMYFVSPDNKMQLIPRQKVSEIWQQIIGYPQDLLRPGPYVQPSTTDNSTSTAEQLKKFIKENGSAAKVSTQ